PRQRRARAFSPLSFYPPRPGGFGVWFFEPVLHFYRWVWRRLPIFSDFLARRRVDRLLRRFLLLPVSRPAAADRSHLDRKLRLGDRGPARRRGVDDRIL